MKFTVTFQVENFETELAEVLADGETITTRIVEYVQPPPPPEPDPES